MSRIFFDTNLFIYLLEDEGKLAAQVARLLIRMEERGDELLTSAMTVGELFAGPYAAGNEPLAIRYEAVFSSPGVRILPFDVSAARRFARIRQDRSISRPDAIQLACAAEAGTDLFLTNDSSLSRKSVSGVQFISTLQSAPL